MARVMDRSILTSELDTAGLSESLTSLFEVATRLQQS